MWHVSSELGGFVTLPGTACTVLYCLLWDGSDGVLDRACNVLPLLCCNPQPPTCCDQREHEQIITDCSGLQLFHHASPMVIFKLHIILIFANLAISGDIWGSLVGIPGIQDASHVPESFWRFAKDQGIVGRRAGGVLHQGGLSTT